MARERQIFLMKKLNQKKVRTHCRILFLCAFSIFLMSCMSWILEKPSFVLRGVILSPRSFAEMNLLIDLEVQNPNRFDLTLKSFECTIYLKNEEIGKRVNVSVLFTDIRGFTSLSERLNPSELSDLLNLHYFSPLDNIIFRHNGTLDKHIGDSIMGIFGAPVGGDDDAGRAVQAALAIREEIAGINEKISDAERRIAIGIGIATGDVMAGIFGSPRKKEYTVLGATVNLASRLENLARANQILICGKTARLVENLVRMEKIPSPFIRGLDRPPDVFSVLGKR
jgi:class 3 adenylate cyclase